MNKISSKEIAQALGMSPSTVSRALNNKGRISQETKEEIFDYIKTNDPDSLYLNNRKRPATVGLVIAKLSNEFFAVVTEKIQHRLERENISLIIMCTNYSATRERQAILSLVDDEVDCILTIATRNATVKKEELHGIPVIAIDDSYPIIDEMVDYHIASDQYVGGILATEELINKGCMKIAYFTNIAKAENDYKFKGYQDALKKHGIPYDNSLYIASGKYSENSIEDAKAMVEYLLASNIQFDGVFATSDRRALGVIQAASAHQISCPEQLKVVGYDGSMLAESFGITSIAQDVRAIADNCIYCILKILGREDHSIKSLIPVYLVHGKTT